MLSNSFIWSSFSFSASSPLSSSSSSSLFFAEVLPLPFPPDDVLPFEGLALRRSDRVPGGLLESVKCLRDFSLIVAEPFFF